MVVRDDQQALWYLETAGYYRLSGYFYPFRCLPEPLVVNGKAQRQPRLSEFIAQSSFDAVASLYRFDNELRLLALSAIEKLEIAIRAKIAHYLAEKDPSAHLNAELMHVKFRAAILDDVGNATPSNYEVWLQQHSKLITRSKEDFVKHFRDKYEPPIPIWVSIEVWDFGLLSHFFNGLNDIDKAAIASFFGLSRFVLLASWLRSISHLRNICAHHSRLWNRALIDNPKPPGRNEIPLLEHLMGDPHDRTHVYGTLAIMQFLLVKTGFGNAWADKLKSLVGTFPVLSPAATLHAMGFPEHWDKLAIWNLPKE
nr:Abi family protein [Massilia sp. CCM 8734]